MIVCTFSAFLCCDDAQPQNKSPIVMVGLTLKYISKKLQYNNMGILFRRNDKKGSSNETSNGK